MTRLHVIRSMFIISIFKYAQSSSSTAITIINYHLHEWVKNRCWSKLKILSYWRDRISIVFKSILKIVTVTRNMSYTSQRSLFFGQILARVPQIEIPFEYSHGFLSLDKRYSFFYRRYSLSCLYPCTLAVIVVTVIQIHI